MGIKVKSDKENLEEVLEELKTCNDKIQRGFLIAEKWKLQRKIRTSGD